MAASSSLLAILFSFFLGTSVSSSEVTSSDISSIQSSSELYDTISDGSSPEYTYANGTLSADEYARVLSGAFVERSRSGTGILVLEYGDFSCPYCQHHFDADIWSSLKKSFPETSMTHIIKNIDLFGSAEVSDASRMAICAGKLSGDTSYYRTTSMFYQLFANLATEGESFHSHRSAVLAQIAKKFGISRKKLDECVSDEANDSPANDAYSEMVSIFRSSGVPLSVIINQKTLDYMIVIGDYPVDYYGAAIAALLRTESVSE
ncbi:MAG TPA: thioredoxin domain-containing protein [bacterium]|nr:thioredoxin domain-containing protein [bacterium]